MIPQIIKTINANDPGLPSRTYKINWDSKHINDFVDGTEAIKQAVDLHLSTERYAWVIHSWQYGSELNTLIGKPIDYAEIEMKRMIKDALIIDRRIREVDNFKFETNGKNLICKFKISTLYGDEELEIDLNA